MVRLGAIIFFCANSDAWMLDVEDNFARPLMRDGVALAHGISETKRQFAIEWNADYLLAGDLFVSTDRESGTTTSISGYPIRVIAEMTDAGMS